jgi:hypothetical protein
MVVWAPCSSKTDEACKERVITFASRQLFKHKKNYNLFLVDMQAMVCAMDLFDTYLRGKKFSVHRPQTIRNPGPRKTMNRLTHVFLISSFVIMFQKGSEMHAVFLAKIPLMQRKFFRTVGN